MRWLAPLIVISAAALAARLRSTSPASIPWLLPDGWQESSSDGPAQMPQWPEPTQLSSPLAETWANLSLENLMQLNVPDDVQARNVRAMLDTIAWAEGADYNTLFGGGTFDSYADHPRQFITRWLGGAELTSSAAGRYQFLSKTWDGLVRKLGLSDFSPASQDAGAIELIRERGALRDVQAGRFAAAIKKIAPVWASLPGAGYSQPERKIATLLAVYAQAGGTTEA